MTRRMTIVLMLVLVGCSSGQLDEETARGLVLGQPEYTDGRYFCGVRVYEFAHGRYSLSRMQRACLDALVDAGVAERGPCADPVAGPWCTDTEVLAATDSRFDGSHLRFPCGTLSFAGITSITTTGAEAAISYERDLTLDEARIAAVGACTLEVADAGRAVRERRARRDDAGRWALETAR